MHKRKHGRYATAKYFDVRHLVTNEVVGFIGNLSPGGLMLYTRQPFPSQNGEIHPLVLVVPEPEGEAHVFLPARQVWSRKSTRRGLYASGFELDGLTAQGRLEVLSVIARYALDEAFPAQRG